MGERARRAPRAHAREAAVVALALALVGALVGAFVREIGLVPGGRLQYGKSVALQAHLFARLEDLKRRGGGG